MSKYEIEFVMKRSIEIEASGIGEAVEEAFTWINHEEFREKHNLKDLGFKIIRVGEVGVEPMDYGPRRD